MRHLLTALALMPVLIPQALWTVLRTPQLPEADGPRTGQTGQGTPLRLLVTGDSSAAGVGVQTQDAALTGQLVAHLAGDFDVTWQLLAKSGGTAASTLALLRDTPLDPCDCVVVALGVNDSKNGVSARAWRRSYTALLDQLRTQTGARHIYVSALPPLGEFTLLPRPLRTLIGTRAALLDTTLRQIADSQPDVTHVAMDIPLPLQALASDGFHPGPQVYTEWARRFADLIRADPASRS